ncbi:multidrug efflux RND transporter permease subunit [Methylosinus sp. H3A]|uniref:multidrug efflux RND transporter permease subunit n=1 Tax=Methylosinus sp. H3A TaxID=2785786 RepID=UPI0018C1E25B|nr:multidrug efflux RND transporter permease subunit [Methylosinus sp. H3A]MBG0808396.1 multidrug efflux RND transporter permease subunit [Methylosinus sp. H3A]
MNPSQLFINRPVATTLLMAAIMLAGLFAYRMLPLSALPAVDYPTIQVQTFYPGASPEVMTSAVTAPLERQFGQMPGLNQMTSSSSAGASIITLQFDLGLSLDVAEQQVQAAINAGGNLVPQDLPTPPIYAKINPADAPIMTLAVTSKSMPLIDVEDYIETRLAQKLSQLPGVGLVGVGHGQRRAIRVRFNPKALAKYGLNIDDLRTIIGNTNTNAPKGGFDGPKQSTTINANDQIDDPAQFRNVIIAYRNGNPIRLSDVAEVRHGPENDKIASWANSTPAIILDIRRQPGANVIDVVENVKAMLPRLQASLPPSLEVSVLSDRTTTIRASVEDVELELMLAVILVVLVIFVFLRNLPATLIPSLSAPLSLVGAFVAMYLMGFSLDNLSLMALTISTGFVVDDAIVVIENIARYIEAGMAPMQAALRGSAQIGFTIVSLTVSLVAVLIPLLFMGDVVGRLFHEFAVTLAVTIVISAFVALSLVPMLCARLLRHRTLAQRSRFDIASERCIDGMIRLYGRALDVVLQRQPLMLAATVATLALTCVLYAVIPKGFFPPQDTGAIQAISEMRQEISFVGMVEKQHELGEAILRDPDVASISSSVGVDGENATLNSGRFFIALKPTSTRKSSVTEVIARLQAAAAQIPGAQLYMQPVQDLAIDSTVSKAAYHFVLENANVASLREWTPKLVERLREAPELANVASDLQNRGKALDIVIDRATAARFGITMAAVDNMLYDAFGQRIVSTIYTQSNQYRVILELDPERRASHDALSGLYLPSSSSSSSGQVPLAAIMHMEERDGPLQITHLGQFPATTISFDIARGASLGAAVQAIEAARREIELPESFALAMQGAVAAFTATSSSQVLLILAAIVTMYIVLGVLYESFVHPITILSTLPSAGVGALLALILTGHDLDVMGVIGIILLIGIVKKNAIMMIDFALEAERVDGLSPRDAIYRACLLRFRPILMTTMAAMLGAVPLMLGSGVGSELRQPLGASIVGGLVVSQMLTLFSTPVVYLYFDRLALYLARVGASDESERSEATE